VRGELAGWGVMLPSFDPFRRRPSVVDAARRAEELGFDSVWVGDHLQFHPPVLEPGTVLAAAAAVTARVRLGTSVMLPALRRPAWIAKQLATLDALAPGRVLFGAGVGGENPAEFEAAGVPHAERGRRVDETLAVLPRLLAGEAVEHEGLLAFRTPGLEPVPERPIPVLVAGRSDAALRRAARHADAWLPVWMAPDRVRAGRERLAELAAELGRPAPAVNMLVFVHVTGDRRAGRREAGEMIAGQYGMELERIERWTAIGGPDEVAEHLGALRAAGVSGFVLVPAAADSAAQYERLVAVREAVGGAQGA
jgi:probable F420-dependent oxidoreductase